MPSFQLGVKEPAKLVRELSRGRHIVIFGAWAHQQMIHEYGVLISIFRLHQREKNHGLAAIRNIGVPAPPVEQHAVHTRHAKIQTTLDLYTQEDGDQARTAQGQFLEALLTSGAIQ